MYTAHEITYVVHDCSLVNDETYGLANDCRVSSPGLGLSCWACNSAFDPRCGETNFDSSTRLDTVDCNQLERNHLDAEPIYCRKIIQRSK